MLELEDIQSARRSTSVRRRRSRRHVARRPGGAECRQHPTAVVGVCLECYCSTITFISQQTPQWACIRLCSTLTSGLAVELSLTGGKDSRLIAAALTAAQVPFRARTHGFASHPDVIVAAMIPSKLGIEHVVTEPRPAAPERAPDEADVLARLRSAVLVSDGMLSAFENVGRPTHG